MLLRKLLLFSLCLYLSLSAAAQTAPDFTITDTNGQSHTLYNDYLDQGKVVVIKFFFTSCTFCQQISPSVQSFYEYYGDEQMEIFSLSIQSFDSNADVEDFKQEYGLTFSGAGEDGGALTAVQPYLAGDFGQFFGTPTFAVISPNGEVQFNVFGMQALEQAVLAAGVTPPVFYSLTGGLDGANNNQSIGNADVYMSNQDTPITTGPNGKFTFPQIPAGTSLTITPTKTINPTNGLSILDLLDIQLHLLGSELLNDPYKVLSADTDQSGNLSLLDLVTLRQVMLGQIDEFHGGQSWQFVTADQTFSNPNDPWADNPQGSITISELDENSAGNNNFIGIKIGDTNGTASPNNFVGGADHRSDETMFLNTVEQRFNTGDLIDVPIFLKDLEQLLAYQFTFQFDLEVLGFKELVFSPLATSIGLNDAHFGLNKIEEGIISSLWFDAFRQSDLDTELPLFHLHFEAKETSNLSQVLHIKSSLLEAMAVDKSDTNYNLELRFDEEENEIDFGFSVSPNPISEATLFKINLPEAGLLKLSLMNAQGRFVETFIDGQFDVGMHEAVLKMGHLPTGVYFLSIEIDGMVSHVERLVLSR